MPYNLKRLSCRSGGRNDGGKSTQYGLYGLDAFVVEVETDLSRGLPAFEMVGLPDAAVREARDRVRAALKNVGFQFPVSRITVNLAPADKRKEGTLYDLPILISLLRASGQLDAGLEDSVFLGGTLPSGEVRPIRGALPMAIAAKEAGFRRFYIPRKTLPKGRWCRDWRSTRSQISPHSLHI